MKTLVKVIVGSQAHGLATKDSDFDYRGVYIAPTSKILSLGNSVKTTQWIEDKKDDTSFELGKFLNMAVQCNPTILEVFCAPRVEESEYAEEFSSLFKYVWTPKRVADAHIGYGINQRKKFLEKKDGRPHKYAAAYLRSLYQGFMLLATDQYPVSMTDSPIYDDLKRWKSGDFEYGEVVELCMHWEQLVRDAQSRCKHQPDLDKINDFLLKVRKDNW